MRKYFLVSVTLLLLGSGCAKQPASTNTFPQEETNTPVEVSFEESINSPFEALLKEEVISLSKPNIDYPPMSNIRITLIDNSSFKVIYTEDGLRDDVLKMREYEMKLVRQNDGTWKVTDKKLAKEECWLGRSCNEVK